MSNNNQTRRNRRPSFSSLAQEALDRIGESAAALPEGSLYQCDKTLAELRPGQCGTILRYMGDSRNTLRLMEMGLTLGAHVKVLRAAAFGGPIEVLVRGYQLSLRREEAALIWLGEE